MARRRKVAALIGGDPEYARELGSGANQEAASPAQEDQRSVSLTEQSAKPHVRRQTSETPERVAVHLFACPKAEHEARLLALEERGLSMRDVIKLAGRRASAGFVPLAEFKPASAVPQMHSRYAYKTTRLYDGDTLEALRRVADPVGVMSNAALLRGQFETVFWNVLDQTMLELTA